MIVVADKLSYHYGHNSTAFSFCPAKFLFFCKLLYLVLLLLPITPPRSRGQHGNLGVFSWSVLFLVRGDVGGSAKKVGKRIKELERIYGIKEGRPEKLPNNSVVKSQSALAAQMGISVDTLQNYKALTDMIPELSPTKKTPPENSPLVPCVSVFTAQFLQSQYKGLDRCRLSLCL